MIAFKEKLLQGKISSFFFMVVIFLLPISRELFVIALWPWILFLLIESILTGWSRWLCFKSVPYTIYFLPGLFLLLMISLLWTKNLNEGWNHIGRSALILILPLFLGFDKTLINDMNRLRNILRIFVFGTIASLLFLLIYALNNSLSFSDAGVVFDPQISSWENAFFYSHFSVLIHPTYYGLMVLMAVAICLNEIKRNNVFSRLQLWPVILSIGLLCSILLISSRTVIIASVFIVGWYGLARIPKRRIRIFSVVAGLTALLFIVLLHPRFSGIREIIGTSDGRVVSQLIENTDRGKTWHASFILLGKYPVFGLGIGDVKDSLSELYIEEDYFDESHNYLNCHNQFLETWLGVGIIGFLLLLIMLIFPFLSSWSTNRHLYWSFFLIILIGFMFESLLNRLWGVAFISIFYSLLSAGADVSSRTNDGISSLG